MDSDELLALAARVEAGETKALSIRQPWCHHILYDGKDVENRDWPTRGRGWFLIHASKSEAEDRELIRERKMPLGAVVGAARITDCVEAMDSEWFCGRFGFVLQDAVSIDPVPVKGALGFFALPAVTNAAVAASLRARAAQSGAST